MNTMLAAACGAAGALVHELFELGDILRTRRRDVPEEWRTVAFVLASVLRLAAGAGIAAGLAALDEVRYIGAFCVGILGPLAMQRLADVMMAGPGKS